MKDLIAAALLTLIFWGMAPAAEAAWLLDSERYHVSVHGRLACLDCHSDVEGKERHPDPVDVNRSLEDFFRPDQCAACHEETAVEIAEGRHAGQQKTPWQNFENCLACHDPHYQLEVAEDAVRPDLSRPAAVKCSLCHEFQSRLPGPSEEDQPCLECHLAAAGDDPAAVRRNNDLCFDCHGAARKPPYALPLIDAASYQKTPHRDVACLICHPQAAAFGHGNQTPGNCGQCHLPHNEKVTHDLHAADGLLSN